MKLIIIFGIIAVAYLVYCSLTVDNTPTSLEVEKPTVEEVSMPDKEFKNAIGLAAGIAVLIVSLIAAAFLL
jgi:hypothetical protein